MAEIELSILFMRFRPSAILFSFFFKKTFNSLYEIHPGNLAHSHTLFNTFNSLYEILNKCTKQMKKWAENFQFSLWDSNASQFSINVWADQPFNSLYEILNNFFTAWQIFPWTFNSLYEILIFVWLWYWMVKHFQFSLWDSVNGLKRMQNG